jgi:flagellar biosynthetic protein FliP
MDTSTVVLVLRVALALGTVLGVLWWLGRRLARGGGARRRTAALTVVARHGLGQKASIAVVDADGRRLLLGVSEHGVTLLAELESPAVAETAADERVEIDPADLADLVALPTTQHVGPGGPAGADRPPLPVHPRGTDARGPRAPPPPRGIDPGRRDVAPGGGRGAGTDHPSLTTQTIAGDPPVSLRRATHVLVLAGLVAALTTLLVLLGAGASEAAQPAAVDVAVPGAVPVAALTAVPAGVRAAAEPVDPAAPTDPAPPAGPDTGPTVSVDINGVNGEPSSPIVVLLTITLLSVAPSLLLMMTGFTKIFVVLALTRNALGLQGVPPNQVLAGLALFLSLFVMAPVVSEVNDTAVQPYLNGEKTFSQAVDVGQEPLREFMLGQTRESDIALVTRAADRPNPDSRETVELTTLIPAFMLSELRSAFLIGFVIFVPFLVIDLVVSASLMSLGMVVLPPVLVSLPFKLLLFVLVDGWGLVLTALVGSYGP